MSISREYWEKLAQKLANKYNRVYCLYVRDDESFGVAADGVIFQGRLLEKFDVNHN